jgi:hypothetical protein
MFTSHELANHVSQPPEGRKEKKKRKEERKEGRILRKEEY